ncbi:MAG: tetratricopeptide repeat protein, partial [Olleya sp.]
MKFKSILLLTFLLTAVFGYSQDMQKGYNYLETGKYAEAELFFNTVLKEYPNNKTARLCYGRAIGLNGKPKQANTLFSNLLADYPN